MNLTVANIPVRQDAEGRICLNDLHRAAGGQQKDRPKYWLSNQQTKALVTELEIAGIPPIFEKQGVGTYVCRDLAYAYAMWISPAFFLKVVRVYDAVANSMTGHLPAETQTADHYESEYARLKSELDRLEVTPICMSPSEYRALNKPYLLVGDHPVRAVDMIHMTETYGVPRKAVEELLGINNNTMRQHALRGRRLA